MLTVQWLNMLIVHFGLESLEPFTPEDRAAELVVFVGSELARHSDPVGLLHRCKGALVWERERVWAFEHVRRMCVSVPGFFFTFMGCIPVRLRCARSDAGASVLAGSGTKPFSTAFMECKIRECMLA